MIVVLRQRIAARQIHRLYNPTHKRFLLQDAVVGTEPESLLSLVVSDPPTGRFFVFNFWRHQAFTLEFRPMVDVTGGMSKVFALRLVF